MREYHGPLKRKEDLSSVERAVTTFSRWQPVLTMLVLLYLAFGFGLPLTPRRRLEALEGRTARVEAAQVEMVRYVRVLAAARCLDLNVREQALAQIDCEAVMNRVRNQAPPDDWQPPVADTLSVEHP